MLKASDVIREAKRYVGYRESEENQTKFGKEYGWNGVPWCQIFQAVIVKRAYARAGSKNPKADASKLVPWTASCWHAVQWFKKRGQFSRTPRVGSQVFFGPQGSTHVELVIDVKKGTITTIGGNTSGRTLNGKYYNGNGVYIKTISRSEPRIYGYGHPKYGAGKSSGSTAAKTQAKSTKQKKKKAKTYPKYPGKLLRLGSRSRFLRKWQAQMRKRGWRITVDGIFGPETLRVVRAFQREKGLAVDGIIGPETWAAAWTAPIT